MGKWCWGQDEISNNLTELQSKFKGPTKCITSEFNPSSAEHCMCVPAGVIDERTGTQILIYIVSRMLGSIAKLVMLCWKNLINSAQMTPRCRLNIKIFDFFFHLSWLDHRVTKCNTLVSTDIMSMSQQC